MKLGGASGGGCGGWGDIDLTKILHNLKDNETDLVDSWY